MRVPLHTLIPAGIAICVVVAVALVAVVSSGGSIAILDTAGPIAEQQRNLMLIAFGLMLLVVIPVFILTFYIGWKYRAGNTEARYEPEWDGNVKLEALWWGFPFAIIAVLAVLAWTSTYNLEPARALQSDKKPLVVQVVALQWKWLFLYPEQQVASVNYVQFPADRPVEFQITSDAPMNSFWIPRLGGQIYAMAGMTTRLHLIADQPGSFHGTSANISGKGFAAMNFTAEASDEDTFQTWVADTRKSSNNLSLAAYTALSRPKTAESPIAYATYEPGLYDAVIAKYSAHGSSPYDSGGVSQETLRRLMHD